MNTQLSIYIPIHNHPGLLHYVLDSCIGIANELVIVDGAYKGMVPWLEMMGINPSISTKETLDIIDLYKDRINIVYHSGTWKDEPEKHLFGFNACKNNIVLTVDSDEPFIIYPEELEKFIVSGKFAGTFTEKAPVTGELSFNFDGTKRKIFNKNIAHTIPHYDYLPLLRDYTVKIDWNSVYSKAIGHICHLYSFRPASDQYSRTMMYSSISGRSPDNDGMLSGRHIKAMGPEIHKRCYMWDCSQHSTHGRGVLDVIMSKDYPLYEVAKKAYDNILEIDKNETNILDVGLLNKIPIKCNGHFTQLDAPDVDKYNTISIQFADQLDKSKNDLCIIGTHYRVFKDNKISDVWYSIEIALPEHPTFVVKTQLNKLDNGGEVVKSFITIKLGIEGQLYTYITKVTFQ